MNQSLKIDYILNKKKIILFLIIVTAISCSMAFSAMGRVSYGSADDIETEINTTLGDNLEAYAGIFSTTVTNAVNPTGTLTFLAVIGTIENYQTYFPQNDTMDTISSFLNDIPFLRTIGKLPIANPYAAVIFLILTIVLYVVRSTSASKVASKATVDQIEYWCGLISSIALCLLPMATSTVVAAQTLTVVTHTVSAATFAITVIIGIMSAIFCSVVYIAINNTVDAIEMLGAIVPIPKMNLIIEILKGILHILLIILQIFSPVLSFICSILCCIIGFVLFRYAYTITCYFNALYVQHLYNKVFRSKRVFAPIFPKAPKKVKEALPNISLLLPVFTLKKMNNIKKREKLWLVVSEQTNYFIQKKRFRKPRIIKLDSITTEPVQMEQAFRFIRMKSTDSVLDFVLCKDYAAIFDVIQKECGFAIKEKEKKTKKESVTKKIEHAADAIETPVQADTSTDNVIE